MYIRIQIWYLLYEDGLKNISIKYLTAVADNKLSVS